ncbi:MULTISPECIES: hypothetical protein [Vibrio]|nr:MULTISPECIES: hypothetical protein [Vibrio]
MAAKLPCSINRTALAPNAPKATPKRMKEILLALRKNQGKQIDKK